MRSSGSAAFIGVTSGSGNRRAQPSGSAIRTISRKSGIQRPDRSIAGAVLITLFSKVIQDPVLTNFCKMSTRLRRGIDELCRYVGRLIAQQRFSIAMAARRPAALSMVLSLQSPRLLGYVPNIFRINGEVAFLFACQKEKCMADLFRLSASEAAADIREGKLTSEELVG